MKLTAQEKARYKALLQKADRNADEETEFKALKAKADAEGYKGDGTDAEDQDGKSLSDTEVKKLIADGVSNGLKTLGISDDLLTKITASIEGSKSTLTVVEVEAAIKKHLGGGDVDKAALVAEITKSIKENTPAAGINQTQLDEAMTKFADQFKTASKHQFPAGKGFDHYPVEHRSGNMTVAQKQLLNICLMNVSDEGLAKSNFGQGIKRPTNQNDGIDAKVLANAKNAGAIGLKKLQQEIMLGRKTLLTSTAAGSGDELVPSDLSSDLQMRLYIESQLAAEFMASEIDMPTNPFTLPLITTRAAFRVGHAEGSTTALDDGTPGTGNTVLTAAKLIGLCEYTYESDEDSIIAILPMLQQQLSSGAADAFEDAVINGDTTSTHQDTDTALIARAPGKLFKGLRKYALAVSALKADLSTGNISAANVLALKKLMLKYGLRPRELLIITGVKGHSSFLGLDETITADKVGNDRAAILTGDAPQLFGSRIVVSSQCREDTDATGVNGASGNTKGTMLIVHRPSFIVGVRRDFLVEVDVDKKTQINSVIASFRRAFMPRETPSASISSVVCGYNFTP